MTDFSDVFQQRVLVWETPWLMLGTFVPVCFFKGKNAQGVVVVIFPQGVSVCHRDGIPGED